jgi:hypothetical protein
MSNTLPEDSTLLVVLGQELIIEIGNIGLSDDDMIDELCEVVGKVLSKAYTLGKNSEIRNDK